MFKAHAYDVTLVLATYGKQTVQAELILFSLAVELVTLAE